MKKRRPRIKSFTKVKRNKSIDELEAQKKALVEMYKNVSDLK